MQNKKEQRIASVSEFSQVVYKDCFQDQCPICGEKIEFCEEMQSFQCNLCGQVDTDFYLLV